MAVASHPQGRHRHAGQDGAGDGQEIRVGDISVGRNDTFDADLEIVPREVSRNFFPLLVGPFGWNCFAHARRRRDEWFERECDAGDVCLESGGDRDRIIGSRRYRLRELKDETRYL